LISPPVLLPPSDKPPLEPPESDDQPPHPINTNNVIMAIHGNFRMAPHLWFDVKC